MIDLVGDALRDALQVLTLGHEARSGDTVMVSRTFLSDKTPNSLPTPKEVQAWQMTKGRLMLRTEDTRSMAGWVGGQELLMGKIKSVDEIVEGERVVVSGGGKDRLGNTLRLSRLALELAPAPDAETDVSYGMVFNLYGRLATLGNAMVKRKAEEVRVEFTKRIIAELEGSA